MESDISPIRDIPFSEELPDISVDPVVFLQKTALMKLNGGLGTSMGLSRAKSLLPVKDGLSFLDIIIRQVLQLRESTHTAIPLIFMNSFSTEDDTMEVINQYPELKVSQRELPFSFLQNRVPKLSEKTLRPVCYPENPSLTWCPPGHGDFYTSLVSTGLLDQLISEGIHYVFISNADNLGATLDPSILTYFASGDIPFMMEVTDRTPADRKGGHIAHTPEGRILLRESAQCHPDETDAFQDIERHRYFNTNNLWINLLKLSETLKKTDNVMPLPVIANKKTVNPKDADSESVYQLETAMGAAIEVFTGARALRVPRTRFAPVKTTNDLLALWSDIFKLDSSFHVIQNPERTLGTIDIDLAPSFYKLLDDFTARFPDGAPSLLHCSRLCVKGDYLFESGIAIHDELTLPATESQVVLNIKAMEFYR